MSVLSSASGASASLTSPTPTALSPQWQQRLVALSAARYLQQGKRRYAYYFARSKLAADPAFALLLPMIVPRCLPGATAHQALSAPPRVLDLGCGQGLLAAWLASAQQFANEQSPSIDTAQSLGPLKLLGIDSHAADIARAQAALSDQAAHMQFVCADLRNAVLAEADIAVLLDVLHYLPPAAQDDLLARVQAALPRGGQLLLRVSDAAYLWRNRLSQAIDCMAVLMQQKQWPRLHTRSIGQWQTLLSRHRFALQTQTINTLKPLANVLLLAQKT